MPTIEPIAHEAVTVPLQCDIPAGLGQDPVSGPVSVPAGGEEAPAAPTPCPRCGAKLINPGSLGWCMKCGYCKSLEEESAKVLPKEAVKKASSLGIIEALATLKHVPDWVWTLLAGAVVIVVISFGAHVMLPPNSYPRALWSTLVIAGCVMTVFIVQIWLMVELAPKDEENRLSPWQLLWIFPARLWKHAFKRLPETRRQISIGAWAWVGIKCTIVIVGGMDFWYQYYQPKKIAGRGLQDAVAAVEAAADNRKSLEESIEDFAGKGSDLIKKKTEDKTDRRPAMECVIIGYTVDDADGKLAALIIATIKDDSLTFAGVVHRGLTPEVAEELQTRFAKLVRPNPFIRGLRIPNAVWVKPEVFCEVQQSGWTTDGTLNDARFKALLAARR